MKRFLPHIALALVLAQLLLMLGSWLWSAALPLSGVRSMLSGEGIRWFLGHFAEIVGSPVLVWLLLLAMAYGAVARSRGVSVVFLVIYVGIVLLLTVVPHAVLLSASLVPLAAFGVLMAAIIHGVIAGSFQSLVDVYGALVYGLRQCAPMLPLYILLVQFLESLRFVLP